jgi:molecular chaperone Hsp33
MLQGLGEAEAQDILSEQGRIEVDCDFCGAQYHFDAVDAARLFKPAGEQPPSSPAIQ